MRRATLLAVGIALGGCAPGLRSGADFDPAVELSAPLTFGWDVADPLPTGDIRFDNNPIVEQRVRGAIERALAERGVEYSNELPDLLVHYHGAVRDRVDVVESDRASGYQTSRFGDGTEVYQYEEGTLVVDIADRESRKVIWRGWAIADVGSALDDPEKLTELVNRGVDGMFDFFPLGSANADR